MSKTLLRAVLTAAMFIAAWPCTAFAASVDLNIYSMNGSPDPITLGTGNVTYTVNINNASTSAGTNVVLTNTLPASSTYVSSTASGSGTCSQSAGTVTCSWPSIGAGSFNSATIVVTPTAGGALTLSSSVTGTESDPNTINNSASKAVIVNSQIDLGIASMTVTPDPITLGTGDVQFLVQFANNSTSQATNAVLTSTIPVNSTFVSATTPVGSGSCSQSAGTVTCNWASIGAGATYYAYITVTPAAGGVLTLSSSVSATQSDPNTSNNSGSKAVTVNAQIDLGISSMTVTPDPMTLGTGNVQYLVQYTNGSTSQATNVVLTSTLPASSTFVSATTPVGSGTCSQSAGTVTCNWASIGPGSTYYAYITVTPTAAGALALSSTVSAAQSDPNTSNNSGSKAVTVNSQIDLGISSMTVLPDPMTLGTGDVQFLVQFINNSTSQATNAVLTSTIPVNSTFVSATTPVGSGTCSQSAGTVTCNWASIGPGSTYYAYITVTPAAGGVLTLSSSVSAMQSDPNPSNNSGSKAVTVNSQIDLGISSMTVSPDPMTLGTGNVQFLVQYTNASSTQATNVVLTSTLPASSTFVSATTPVGSGACSQSAGTVTCNWASIGPGSTYYAYITITPTAAGTLTLSSAVSAAQSDPNTSNNSASKAVTVYSDIDLSVSSITGSPDPITLGSGNVLYTVYVYNSSGSQATNVVLTSTLPGSSTFVSATTPVGSGTCSQSAGTVTCNWASIGAGTQYYAYITVTPTANGVMTLSASVAGAQTDSNTINNSAAKGVTVGTAGAGVDLSVYSVAGTPDPITLNTGNVTYTVSVFNGSTTTGTNTVLTNTLPTNSTYVSSSATNSGTCTPSGGTVTCNWTSTTPSGFNTATIVVTPTAGGSLTLSAMVAGTESDPNTANNSGNKSVTVNSKIDLQLYSVSATPDPITLNTGNVTYSVSIYNASTSQGTNTVLTNTLPVNSTFVSAAASGGGTCTPSAGTVTCNWSSIPAGGFYTTTIVVTPTAGGSLTLSSSVAGTETDSNTANNSGNRSVTVNSQIDLRVYSITGTPDPITLNTGNVTYSVAIYNNSTSQGTNTVLTNTLPTNSTYVSSSATNGGTCTPSGGTVTCNWSSIAVSSFNTATIVVTPTSGGSLTLSANVSGTETDPNTADNSGSKSVTVNSQIDLQLYSMSATPDPITLNTGNVTYSVNIYNNSSSQGTNTVLTSTLPANSTFVSASATNSGTCTQSAGTLTCSWASIPASSFYGATIVVTPTAGGALTLSSSVAGTETDSNTANNSSSKSVTVNSQIDLQIYSMSATPDPITLNTGNVTYTVNVYNPSSSQGTGTVLTNTLPSNSTYVSSSASNGGSCVHAASTVTCNWASIPTGGFYTVTIVVTPTAGGAMTLASSVSGTEPDSNTANNNSSRSVTVNSQIDLQLYSMSATPDPITLNTGNVTYTVNVFNNSSSQGTSTVLTNTLPANSTYVSASATNSGTCTQSAGIVTCNWTSIPASGFYSATIVVTPTAGGPLTLSSNVSGAEGDPNTANNNGNHSVTVNDQIDLKVYSISGSPNPITFGAGNVTFSVSVYNQSSSQGTNVVLTNTLPSNSTYVSSSASNTGTCSHSASTVTCSWTSLPAFSIYSATVVVTPTTPGTLTLAASVAGTQTDPNTADNSASGTTAVTPTSCTAVPSGAVSWYRAENNGVDSTGPNFATAAGGATYTTGEVGQAFSLNGTTAYVSAPDNTTLHRTAFTIEGWFNLTGGTGIRTIVSKTAGTSFSDSFVVYIAANGALAAGYGDTSSIDAFSTSTFPTTNAWHHFAYTYDGTTQQLYLDGASAGSAAATTAIAYDTHPLLLGADIDNEALISFFPGRIDEVTMYNRVLPPAEVQTVFGAGTFGKCYVAAPAPTIAGFTPGSGVIGTSVVITGTDFTAVSAVKFNGTAAAFTGNTATQITATVPAAATTGTISVVAGGGTGTSASAFTVITTAHWINASGGNWNTPSNWSTGTVPTSANDVVIDASGTYTVNLDVTPAFNSLTVGGGATGTQALDLGVNHDVTFTNPGTVTASGALTFGSGRLLGTGPLTVNGVMNWTSDAEVDTTVIIATGGTLNISGFGTRYINGGTLNNSGTVNWSGGNNLSVYNSGVINNLSTGLFAVTNDQLIYQHCCGAMQAFNNAGTFRKTVATSVTTIDGNGFNNSGTLDVQSGSVLLGSGGTSTGIFNATSPGAIFFSSVYTLGAGATLTGNGNYQLAAGQISVAAAGVTVNHLTLAGGNLDINGGGSLSTTSSGVIDWNADATLSGAGTLNVAAGGTLNFSGFGTRYIAGGTLNNSGTINWSGGNNLSIYDSGVINNLAGGLFLATNDQIIYFHCCAPGQAFNNAGTFRKTTATSTTTIQANGFTNSGTVDVQSGTVNLTSGGTSTAIFNAGAAGRLLFNGAAYTLSGAATLTGAGNFEINGGQLNVTGSAIAVNHLTMNGGTLNVTGAISTTPAGVVDWSADSTLTGAGSMTIASGATMNITGFGTRYIDGGTLNNDGTIDWSGGNNISVYNSGVINNHASGVFNVKNDQIIYFHCCTPGQAFNNAGTFRKTIATSTTTFQANGLTNSGTVDVQSGTLNLTSGGTSTAVFNAGSSGRLLFTGAAYTLSGAATLTGPGNFEVGGGQLNVTGSSIAVDHFTLSGGTLNVTGAMSTTASGVIDWPSDSVLTGAGSMTIASGAAMNINGFGTRYIDGGTLNNIGTVHWSGGNNLSIYNSGVINNQSGGLFDVTNDQLVYFHCCLPGQAFNNAGTFRKSSATSTTTFQGIGFANSGTIQPQSGVIALNSTFTSSGSPAYNFGIGSATSYGRIAFANAVSLTGALIAAPINGFVPQGGQQFTIVSFPSGTATFSPKTLTFGSSPVRSFADSYSATAVTLTASGPTITAALSPNQGSDTGGTPVTITGSGFVSGGSLAVSFGGTAATAVTFVNATTITCTTPAHAAGTVDVVVTNGDGQPSTATNAFTYLGPADIAISGSAPATATNGGTFTYTTVVTNNGPPAAAGVTATITLPPNVTLSSATSTQGTCSGTTTITCSIGVLPAGGTATQTINLTATGSGTAVLNASASSAQSDTNSSNNVTTSNVAIGGTSALFVTTNADTGTGSLRQAILDANNASVCTAPCTISFNLPGAQLTITPPTSLPAITAANVTIDATTQPGYSGAPLVTLDGSNNPNPSAGLQLSGGSDTVKGLSIVTFQGSAIVIDTAGNDVVAANYLGLHTDGTTPGQNAGSGVMVTTANNTIGGSNAASRNVISGNFGSGVVLKGATATGNAVRGNYIGLNAAGTSNVANITDGIQILLGASNNIIGGTTAADRNVISGNNASGIYVTGTAGAVCSDNLISANFIGTDAAGTASIGNSTGIYLGTFVSANTIGGTAAGTGNTIVSNTTGISFDGPGDANALLGNSITGNSGMTIDLGNNGPTANDAGDADTGPNEYQNTPTFVDASMAGSTLTAHVNVDSASVANTAGIRVELFKSDASGVHALSLLASQCFAGNALNGVTMTVNSAPVVIGDKLVATATSYTDAACTTVADGTSEDSNAATITTCTPPSATITPGGPTTFCTGGSVTLTASAGASYQWRNFATPIIGANGQQYVATTAGSYTVTVTNAAGCSATSASTSVTVNSAVNVTISAGGPTTFCSGGAVTLTANPSGGSGSFASYQWLLNGSPIGAANATTYNATATGNYSVTVTDTNGCTGTSAPQSVSVTTPPSAAINAPASVCANSSAGANIVSPVGGATYTWTVTNGSVTFGQGTSSIVFAAGTASPVSISVVASLGGCTSNGSASVAVGAFTPTITGSNSFCPGGNTTLTASAANSYQWSLNGSPIGGATAQTYVATAAGNYTVTESNASGCNGTSAPFTVSQAPLTPPTVTPGGPTTFCSGGSVTLTSSAAATYQWLINGSPIGGSTAQSINVTSTGSYSVTITSGSCSATSSATAVTVNPTPAVSITGPTAVCAGGSATLDAGAGFATYAWSTGATTQTITVSPASTTTYSVTVTNNGCSASASKTVTISSGATTATILAPSSVPTNSTGNTASVPPAQAGSSYNWTISGGTITSGNGTPSIVWTAGNSGTATISITITSASCTASGSVNVTINDSADLALTMTATPNPVPAGGTITFALNAINNGPSDAQNVTLINSLFGITAASATGNGWSCNVNGLSVVCTRPSLAAGAAASITITATATANSAGDTAGISSATSDPNTTNNSVSASVAVTTPVSCNNNAPSLISPAAGASNLASSVNFTWSAAANAMSYDLWIASSGGAPAIATTTQSTSAIINLPSGMSTWYVAAHFPNNCPTLASPPRDLTVAASTNCTQAAPQLIAPSPNANANAPVTFSWTPVAQAIGYRLWLAIDGGALQDATTTNGATSVSLPLSGSSVVWHVDALFPGCPATSSPSSSFTLATNTGCASHAAPSLLGPAPNVALQSSIVDLQWASAAGANGYRVWASINGSDFAPIGNTPPSVTTLHFTFTTGSVAWYVEALFDGCPSTAASQQSFTIPAAQNCNNTAVTPLAPANNGTLTNGFVEFDWTAAANAAGYELWLSIDGGAPSLAGTTTTTSLSRTVGTGTIDWYIRTLFDRCDPVDSAHLHFTIAPPANCSVARPILTSPFDGAHVFTPFDLQWSSVPGATQYKVRLGSSGDAPVVGTTSALHLDNVTAPAGPVTWSVEALFDNCPAVRSTASTFTAVAPPPPCSTPEVPQPRAGSTASTNVEYVIRWTPSGPKATTQYELQESAGATFTAPIGITTDANERSFTHANSGDAPVTFYYRVRAIGTCNGARSLFSPAIAVQVLPSNVTDPSNANGSTPADNPQPTHYQLHLGGGTNGTSIKATAGDTFTATTNQPWLTVTPSTGTVAPEGTTLNVTANTNGLPVGTSTAAVNVIFGSSTGSSRTTPLDNKPPATTTVSVNLVQPVSPTAKSGPPPDALITPAVAHADGINSKFQSDVRVTNSSAQPMKYQVTFTPTGDAGITQGKQTTLDIDPGHTIALDDVLESWFGSNGATGTLEVRPVTATTNSTSAALPAGLANLLTFASSRTFNTTSNGTFGQYIPAIPFAAFVGRASDPSKSTILSLQQIAQSAAYRTNLGILEGSGDPASVLVSVFGDDGHKLSEFTQDLKGGQHIQLNSILAQKNVQVNDGRIEIKVVTATGKVTAYASVLDNLTNDPLLVTPVAVNATAAAKYVIPGVADLNNGIANWQTDVRLFNPSANIVKATLTFYSQSGAAPQSKDVSLAPNQVQTFDAALHQFFGLTNDGGALHISTTATTPLVATARTYNQTPNGTYGQFIPAVTANDAAALGTRPLQLLQIEESDRYRTNVGFAEVTGKAATVEVTAIPSDSKVAASTQINLAPNQFIQYPQLLKSMGLTNMYNTRVTVKVISGQGRVTAYASVIDSKTNDPTFVPAQ